MAMLQLQNIYVYPIKSLGGVALQQAEVQPTGLQHDRRWMLVDQASTFITQRTVATMALLQVNIERDRLTITHKKGLLTPLHLPFGQATGRELTVSIWNDVCTAWEVSNTANEWFTHALQMPVTLVYMPATTNRFVEMAYAKNNEIVSFADAYPFLLIGQSSLNDLNSRLREPVLMNRFRPNFVFSGGEPYCEDNMKQLRIGDITFYGVKPCYRCVLLTVNQEDATKGSEPLKTLAGYRTINNKVSFGQNLLQRGKGKINVGDELVVEQWKN